MKSLLLLLGEDPAGFLDAARMAEKLGVIPDANSLIAIRDLRNTITHDYAVEELNELFRRTLELCSPLTQPIASTIRYADSQFPAPAGMNRKERKDRRQ